MNTSMHDEKDNVRKLDRMLKQAAEEKPVMSIDDVQNLLQTPRVTPSKKNLWLASAILLLSVGGIVLSVILSNQEVKVATPENKDAGISQQSASSSSENSALTTTLSKENTPSKPVTQEVSQPEENKVSAPQRAAVAVPEIKTTPTQLTQYKAYTYYYNKPGHKVEITVIDGQVTELTDNEEIKKPEDYDQYSAMIQSAQLKAALEAKQTSSDEKSDKEKYKEWKQQLAESLLNDQLIDDPEKYEFSFENNSLVVNGIKRDEALFQKYKLRYEEMTGKKVHAGTLLKIKKQ